MTQTLIDDFVGWQCLLRQRNFRKFSGKPSNGTVAQIIDKKTNYEIFSLQSILMEKNPLKTAQMFEFMIKKTHDPEERYLKAVQFFSSEYFEETKNFDGSFSATFSNNSSMLKKILNKKKLTVQFFEHTTGFNFSVNVSKLKKNEPEWMYTFYHNSFFNTDLRNNIEILLFIPETKLIKKIS